MKTVDIPDEYRLKSKTTKLNAKWMMKPTPGKAEEVQTSLKDGLKEQILKQSRSGRERNNQDKSAYEVKFFSTSYALKNEWSWY